MDNRSRPVKAASRPAGPGRGRAWTALVSGVFTYLLLLPELHLHLLVPELVFANAVSSDEVAADIRQLWVLFSCLFDKAENNKSHN